MKITVFTPAYNRGYILPELYRSLQAQTFADFEWLVIDDGSSDRTPELFKAWEREQNPFSIRYFRVENGGKHRAINKGVNLARGELFFIVDSDDRLTPDALESIAKWEEGLQGNSRFCGVAGNRGADSQHVIGTTFEGEYVDATSLERTRLGITGDKAEVFYTKILRNYRFDEIEGEKFLTESTVWDRMAYDGLKLRWFNHTIYICDYLEDGLTRNMKRIFSENPKGTALYIKQQIKHYNYDLRGRLSNYNLYYDFVGARTGLRKAARYLEIHPLTLLAATCLVRLRKLMLQRP
ncbi:glycosyltransferase family 2 protein [Paenibacillus sabinae]|uniref:LPS biosynthesis related glycosyltransferase n=1 Tax=Paenibacillus sabinae T27 TaxID=1268072 RepID=X4ZVM4_9BACL|nr:glycosyltransferase family 2 protein [Paenibacillus sabinae]AHV95789.1 LPS biosynthesis related glycosyltransferase [Paenibacillus sabinae T27]